MLCLTGFSLPWNGSSDHPPLLSSMDVQAFLCCWAHQCVLFFLKRMYQTVDLATPNVPAISLVDFFRFWSLIIVCLTCMESSFDSMLWVHSNSSHGTLMPQMTTPYHTAQKHGGVKMRNISGLQFFWDQPKHPINSGHQACLEFSFLAACIYCRFLWSTPQMAQLPPHVPKPILQIQTRW